MWKTHISGSNMSNDESIVPLDENLLRLPLPSCLAVHGQLHGTLTCGIIRKTESTIEVLAVATYRHFLSTFDTRRFEINDLVVDEKERNRGLGTRLFHYLLEQAKQCGATSILVQCDVTNVQAHRFLFRLGLTIITYEFCLTNLQPSESNDRIRIIDMPDDDLLLRAQDVYRQLRPHLPEDGKSFLGQIRDICRTGPARVLIATSNDTAAEILGVAAYRVTHTAMHSEHIYCDDLVTNEASRSAGVGRALINHMKKEASNLDIHRLVLDSGCQRGRAHKFYYREGFTINRFGFRLTF